MHEACRGVGEHTLRKKSRSDKVPAELCAEAPATSVLVARGDLVEGRVDVLEAKYLAIIVRSVRAQAGMVGPYDVSRSDQAIEHGRNLVQHRRSEQGGHCGCLISRP